MARVSLILVTWNSARFLPRCLDGIAQQTFRDTELIVVDNGSADDSVAIVRARFPGATIVQNAGNEGFSRAVNQGIAHASGEFVQLVNPDAFLGPEYVAKLVEAFGSPQSSHLGPRMNNSADPRSEDRGPRTDIGSATGKLLKAEGIGVDSKGIRMTRTGRHFDVEEGEERDVFGVSGAAAMHRMSFVRDVTLSDGQFLDEDFFTYREDADVAWRGRLFGWRAVYVPDALGWHVRTVTPQKRRELPAFINMHSVKNRFMMRIKNEGLYLA
ncbi:MAG TPA: glycosyltransferase family 2 protein, partial [Thermoanaerobaculia bacterium]|nr:glycosyltransferase family 2 protein [Thermoanaerobaculia bacterium]